MNTTLTTLTIATTLTAGLVAENVAHASTCDLPVVDEVHVPYRRSIVPGMDRALRAVEESTEGGATISGAGPAIVMLTTSDEVAERGAERMREAFAAEGTEVVIDTVGVCETGALPE